MTMTNQLIRLLCISFFIIYAVTHVCCQNIRLMQVGSGFIKPVDISTTGIRDDQRLFITEKDGRIKILLKDGTLLAKPFLDIDARVNSSANERGLLGLVFHPRFSENGYFFVHYTNNSGHSTISRFKVSPNDENLALPESEKILLVVNQPFNNHNAGDLAFGKNGYLYIGMGDGGSGGDPGNRSQNPKQLLGKMLRIDVNTEDTTYLIPPTNPYANSPDTLPEIWAFGLRNPWRISMDTLLNELWIADVGQDRWEEVNVANADRGGLNYGWRCFEGNAVFNFSTCNSNTPFYAPVHVYANQFNTGCSVTGGFVYRGNEIPDIKGQYIYCDFCSGIFWGISKKEEGLYVNKQIGDFEDMEFATFGTDNSGEVFVAGLGNGNIYKIQGISSSAGHVVPADSFRVFPNPVSDLLTIRSVIDVGAQHRWIISDLLHGFTLMPSVLYRDGDTIVLDVQNLPSGSYTVRNDSSNQSHFFIKI
jgi:glucose/arabinose dehydrogenase